MSKENPFAVQSPAKKEKFHLVSTPRWQWTLTDGEPPFYDRSPDGRLFMADAHCPLCKTVYGVGVIFSYAGVGSAQPKEWVCGVCGNGGEVLGHHGSGELVPREEGDDEWVCLPSCIVICEG